MKLHSVHLNPFQPFPERDLDGRGVECPRNAIEDNLSRALFSALGNAESPHAVAILPQDLAKKRSTALRERAENLAEILRNADPSKVEVGLQSWPGDAVRELAGRNVLLIGISSSHGKDWTHDQRPAPANPRPDAWVYIPGEMLLVFECKNDEHPLDATQISAYAHELKLVTGHDVPRAKRGSFLSFEQARAVQNGCADLVLDANWDAVVAALKHIPQEERVGELGRFLSDQAADYIQLHVHPPYRGIQTILDWLNGPDDADRRNHLRRLVSQMGEQLKTSADGPQHAITFDPQEEMRPGAGAALYVRLSRGGQPLKKTWLGKEAPVVLWFQFRQDLQLDLDEEKRMGLEYYVQARGAQPNESGAVDTIVTWNKAAGRHSEFAAEFEERMAQWSDHAPSTCRVEVTTVRFNGRKRTWQGAGAQDPTGPSLSQASPQQALAFLKANRSELWRFPQLGAGGAHTIEEAARQVRKPALSLVAPLKTSALAASGSDERALQHALRKAVASIDTTTALE